MPGPILTPAVADTPAPPIRIPLAASLGTEIINSKRETDDDTKSVGVLVTSTSSISSSVAGTSDSTETLDPVKLTVGVPIIETAPDIAPSTDTVAPS